ncbi:MAG: tetratricopeptide repeat protein [Lutisporaceae bacterium]
MNKLTLADIKVLGEGPQVKKLIEAKYGTLRKFHQQENPSVCLKSIRDYCSSKKIRSGTFRCLMVNKLDKSWGDIVLTEPEQVTKHVYEIYNNIVLYKQDSDIQLFDKLMELCGQYKLSDENILMYRNIAKNYYFRNNCIKAFEYYNKAINLIGNKNIDILVSLTIELADHYFKERYVDDSERLFNRARCYLENYKVSNSTLYKYYYRKGIVCNFEANYAEALEWLEKSVQYADINTEAMSEKGAAFLAIGVAHKNMGNYEEAKKSYSYAFSYFHEKDIYGRISIFNNLANLYCAMNDYNKAIEYIEQAKDILEKEKITDRQLMVSHTYAAIKLMHDDTSAFYKFIEELKATINSSINKNNIKNNINSMIKTVDDIDMLKELHKAICYIKENTNNDMYIDTLYSCFGRVYEKLILKGGVIF